MDSPIGSYFQTRLVPDILPKVLSHTVLFKIQYSSLGPKTGENLPGPLNSFISLSLDNSAPVPIEYILLRLASVHLDGHSTPKSTSIGQHQAQTQSIRSLEDIPAPGGYGIA